jgi:3',5'-cyclic AMP phosphodiesterase CpdA
MIGWLLSDLHLESIAKGTWDLPPAAARPRFDVLIIAGDLVPGVVRGIRWLQDRVKEPTVIVAGNHELYGRDAFVEIAKGRAAAAGSNVYFLSDSSVEILGTLFIGCTLWSGFNLFGDERAAMVAAADGMRDYHKIRKDNYARRLRPSDTRDMHYRSRRFIRDELEKYKDRTGPCVLVTHHAPHPFNHELVRRLGSGADVGSTASAPDLLTPPNDLLDAAYQSDCTDLFSGVDVALHGHLHRSFDFKVSTAGTVGSVGTAGKATRVVSNPKGYGPFKRGEPWENPDFDPVFTFEI